MHILLLIFLVIIMDQATKYYVQLTMPLGESIPCLENIFYITHVHNPGAAFGILENQIFFLITIAFLMILGVVIIYPNLSGYHCSMPIGIALLIGGAIGNAIDRIRFGYVVDFFDFRIWPVFNIADIAIVLGVCIIVFNIVYLPPKKDDLFE